MADEYPLFDIERALAAYLPAGRADERLCISHEGLQELARRGKRCASYRERMEHLATCSRCWEAMRALQNASANAVTEVLALYDTDGTVSRVGNRLRLASRHKPAQTISKWIDTLLTDGFTKPARTLQTMLSTLKREPTLTLAVRDAPITLSSPVNTVVRTHIPELKWQPVANVKEYRVVLMELSQSRTELISNASMGGRTHAVLPPEITLVAGHLYLWQVVASGDGSDYGLESRSPLAWFAPMTEEAAAELATIENQHSDSALILLGVYERYGLYEDARHQVERLKALNADNELIERMEQQLNERRSLANLL